MQAIVKTKGMIKGVIGYKAADYKNVEPILMQLRSYAMQCDYSVGIMISTWETMEDWTKWVESKGTLTLLRRAKTAVTGTPRITAYRMLPTVEWS